MNPRKPIFDAVRTAARSGLFNDPGNVLALDNLLDAFGVRREAAPAPRSANTAGVAIIKEFESLRLVAYRCPAGIWTIGWGHTGPDVHPGMTITQARAEELLAADLRTFEAGVARLAPVASDNQFSALVSFAFNVGLDEDGDAIAEGLGDSTLLRKHNAGDFEGAAREFAKWNTAKGQVLAGLSRRREMEAELYRKAG